MLFTSRDIEYANQFDDERMFERSEVFCNHELRYMRKCGIERQELIYKLKALRKRAILSQAKN